MADVGMFSIVKLGNSNYGTWKFQMEVLLIREELWYRVDEVKPEPEQSQYPLQKLRKQQ